MSISQGMLRSRGNTHDPLAERSLEPVVLPIGGPSPQVGFGEEVRAGLADQRQQKIPSRFLFDDTGLAKFADLTRQPEHYPTRLENELLEQAAARVWRHLEPDGERGIHVVEIGHIDWPGVRRIKAELPVNRGEPPAHILVGPSVAFLREGLRRFGEEHPESKALGLAGNPVEALSMIPSQGARIFILSSCVLERLEAHERERLLECLVERMRRGDSLLLGVDHRAHAAKSEESIRRAYQDADGAAAHFNLNVIERLNRELGGNFNPKKWSHRAIYNPRAHRVELHLESPSHQRVEIPSIGYRYIFSRGQTILTATFQKFAPGELADNLLARGLDYVEHWSDRAGTMSLVLLQRN